MMYPLVHESQIDKQQYDKYIDQRNKIKLSRYNAYAQIRGLAISFRERKKSGESKVESAIEQYAVRVNGISADIDRWLRGLYCAPACLSDNSIGVDSDFTSYGSYSNVQSSMGSIEEEAHRVSELMVEKMSSPGEGFFAACSAEPGIRDKDKRWQKGRDADGLRGWQFFFNFCFQMQRVDVYTHDSRDRRYEPLRP